MSLIYLAHLALVVAGLVSIICRMHKMSAHTKGRVLWQHRLLFAGLLWSVLVPAEYGVLTLAGGVVAFLLLSADRWKHGAPEGTTKPMPLDSGHLHHVSGGRKNS